MAQFETGEINVGADLAARAVQSGWIETPAGDSVVPEHVKAEIAAFSPLLALRWNRTGRQFDVLVAWPQDDPRRALIQAQQIADNPYDLLTALPPGCPPDQAAAWIRQHVRVTGVSRAEARRILDDEEARLAAQHAARFAALGEAHLQATTDALASKDTLPAKRRRKVLVIGADGATTRHDGHGGDAGA
jgi:hypothetical protein